VQARGRARTWMEGVHIEVGCVHGGREGAYGNKGAQRGCRGHTKEEGIQM
jgi:hypothetical protein